VYCRLSYNIVRQREERVSWHENCWYSPGQIRFGFALKRTWHLQHSINWAIARGFRGNDAPLSHAGRQKLAGPSAGHPPKSQ
jgi:hypothetical protein